MVNSNTVNSKFRLIRIYCEIFFYNFLNIPCLKCAVNSNFHLIRRKTSPTNDFELTVPDLYIVATYNVFVLYRAIKLFFLWFARFFWRVASCWRVGRVPFGSPSPQWGTRSLRSAPTTWLCSACSPDRNECKSTNTFSFFFKMKRVSSK